MGTDDKGRDLLARVLQGGESRCGRNHSTIVSLLVGVSWGAVAGYIGGRVDNLMMRIVDIIYAIPYILIVIVLLSVFGGPNTPDFIDAMSSFFGGAGNQGLSQIFLLFLALGLVSWLTMARVVRGQILSLKNQEFVLAAKATGVSTPAIIFRHLVPNALGPVIVYATLTVERDADGGIPFVPRARRAGTLCELGKPRGRWHQEHPDLPVATYFPGCNDGPDALLA